jgi:hypothetical protein
MSYLSDLDRRFTETSQKVISSGIMSALSQNPAEIIHHYERRLTNPLIVLDENNLIPMTAWEHVLVHDGKIIIYEIKGFYYCIDEHGARFRLKLDKFRQLWREELVQ